MNDIVKVLINSVIVAIAIPCCLAGFLAQSMIRPFRRGMDHFEDLYDWAGSKDVSDD